MNQVWQQNFDPLGNRWLSTLAALIPVCTLFYFLAVRRIPAWQAAIYAFTAGVAVNVLLGFVLSTQVFNEFWSRLGQ